MAFKQHSQQQVHIRVVALAKTSLQIPQCASIILSLRYLSVHSRCCCCCACVMLLKPLDNDYDRLYKMPCSLIISLTFLLNGSDKVLKGEDHSCPTKKKSDKPHNVCRQKIMLTWKVALVLLIFALSLTELNPHSSSLFGTTSEMEVIDAWAGIFLIFFYVCVIYSFLFSQWAFECLFTFFYISPPLPSLTKIAGLRVPGTECQSWSRQLEWENPLLALEVTPALSWRHSLPSYAGSFWSLTHAEAANCPELNAVHFDMSKSLLMTEQNQCIHLSKEFKQGSRNEESCALLTKLSSSVHNLNYEKERTFYI